MKFIPFDHFVGRGLAASVSRSLPKRVYAHTHTHNASSSCIYTQKDIQYIYARRGNLLRYINARFQRRVRAYPRAHHIYTYTHACVRVYSHQRERGVCGGWCPSTRRNDAMLHWRAEGWERERGTPNLISSPRAMARLAAARLLLLPKRLPCIYIPRALALSYIYTWCVQKHPRANTRFLYPHTHTHTFTHVLKRVSRGSILQII